MAKLLGLLGKSFAVGAAFTLAAAVNAATFDFETSVDGPIVTQTVGGITATVTANGNAITVSDTGYAPFGTHSLLDFFAGASPYTANFSALLSSVSVSGGDYGADADTVFLAAYSGLNGTGTLLGSMTSGACCTTSFSIGTASFSGTGIRSIVFGSGAGDPFPQSLFFDNIVATAAPAPEPASWAMMLGGFGMIGGALRSRRRATIRFA